MSPTSDHPGGSATPILALLAAQRRVERLLRLSNVLASTDEAVIRSTSVQELLDAAVAIAVERGGFRMAWVGLVDRSVGVVRAAAVAGAAPGYAWNVDITTRDDPSGHGPTGVAARLGVVDVCNDIEHEQRMEPWRARALGAGLRSSAAFPLDVDGVVVAVLTVYSAEPGVFDDEEVGIVGRLAANLAFGWASRVRDEHRRVADERLAATSAQQATVVELSELALVELDLDALFQEAVDRTAAALGVELVGLTELDEGGRWFRLRAGHGFLVQEVMRQLIRADGTSQAGYVLQTGAPLVVEDLAGDTRFPGAALLVEHGVRSSVTVLIRSGREVFGTMSVHTLVRRAFAAEDVHFLESIANVVGAAIARAGIEDRLRHEALHDMLTGLPNRSLLHDRLEQALARSSLTGRGVGVLLADLDRFKVINDSLGHAAGDELLMAVATRLEHAVGAADTVARLGGDEFVIITEDRRGLVGALDIARRVGAVLDAPFRVAGFDLFSSASVGIAYVDDPGAGPDDVLRDADVAMYHAKTSGGRRFTVFDPVMGSAARGRMEVEVALRRAIDHGELRLRFQPVVDVHGDIASAEALVRWEDPDRGLVCPDEFIPLAEDTGLILELGAWVLREACTEAASWPARPDGRRIGVSVNLSTRQLDDPLVDAVVERALLESGLAADLLTLEITESALVADARSAVSVLRRLESLGVRLAIDDFGTGHSSLAYLKRFPICALKVDRSFVADLGADDRDLAIVAATVELGHRLGLSVVAEGIETVEQRDLLVGLGCDLLQGYLFSRPVTAGELVALLEESIAEAGGGG